LISTSSTKPTSTCYVDHYHKTIRYRTARHISILAQKIGGKSGCLLLMLSISIASIVKWKTSRKNEEMNEIKDSQANRGAVESIRTYPLSWWQARHLVYHEFQLD
jgi:hypothetical protein